jgi:hypothetical protein
VNGRIGHTRLSTNNTQRGFAAIFAILGFTLSIQPAQSQQDLIFGTWKINPAKTTDPPTSETRIYEDRGGGFILSTRRGVDAQGRDYFSQYAAKHDGKEYPRLVRGSKTLTTITFQQVDPYTSTYTLKSDGKVTATGKTVLSKDGKVLTVSTTDATWGQTTTEVYDKQ